MTGNLDSPGAGRLLRPDLGRLFSYYPDLSEASSLRFKDRLAEWNEALLQLPGR